jgi:hypothetical protein
MSDIIKYIYYINFSAKRYRSWPSIEVAFNTVEKEIERDISNAVEPELHEFIRKYKTFK